MRYRLDQIPRCVYVYMYNGTMLQSVTTTYIHQKHGYMFRLKWLAILKHELQDTNGGYSCISGLRTQPVHIKI